MKDGLEEYVSELEGEVATTKAREQELREELERSQQASATVLARVRSQLATVVERADVRAKLENATIVQSVLSTGLEPRGWGAGLRADPRKIDLGQITAALFRYVRPSVSLAGIMKPDGQPADVTAIDGAVDIEFSLDIPPAVTVNRVEVLIDDTIVCRQTFARSDPLIQSSEHPSPQSVLNTGLLESGHQGARISCRLSTQAFDSATGVPSFLPGTHTLKARLLDPDGNIVAESSPQTLIFAPEIPAA